MAKVASYVGHIEGGESVLGTRLLIASYTQNIV